MIDRIRVSLEEKKKKRRRRKEGEDKRGREKEKLGILKKRHRLMSFNRKQTDEQTVKID